MNDPRVRARARLYRHAYVIVPDEENEREFQRKARSADLPSSLRFASLHPSVLSSTNFSDQRRKVDTLARTIAILSLRRSFLCPDPTCDVCPPISFTRRYYAVISSAKIHTATETTRDEATRAEREARAHNVREPSSPIHQGRNLRY